MNTAFRVARASRQAVLVARRTVSGHAHEEAVAEMQKWKKISFGMIAISGAGLLFAAIALGTGHHDHEEKVHPSYAKIRTKPYPWECSDCTYFDVECWKACKANL